VVEINGPPDHASGMLTKHLHQDRTPATAEMTSGVIAQARQLGQPVVTTVGNVLDDPNLQASVQERTPLTSATAIPTARSWSNCAPPTRLHGKSALSGRAMSSPGRSPRTIRPALRIPRWPCPSGGPYRSRCPGDGDAEQVSGRHPACGPPYPDLERRWLQPHPDRVHYDRGPLAEITVLAAALSGWPCRNVSSTRGPACAPTCRHRPATFQIVKPSRKGSSSRRTSVAVPIQ